MGKGQPLILLHGWGQDLTQMRYLGEKLARTHEVHLIDLPGFGKSPMPEGVWSSFDYAECVIGYLDEHQIKKADFAGHSFGGKVALSLAVKYPERIRNLVLMAPSGLRPLRSLKKACRIKLIIWGGKLAKWIDKCCSTQFFASIFIPRFGSADYKNAGAMRSILVRSVNEDLSSLLPQVTASTLILWGEKDTETPKEMAQRMHALLPCAQLLKFPHHGHDLCKDAGAHLCAFHIAPFLGRSS